MWNEVAAVVTICIGIYLWATWNYNYWKKYNIPFIKPVPYFGNVKDLIFMKRNSGQLYTQFYWKYPEEPAVGVYYLRSPQLLLRDLDLIKTTFTKEFANFHSIFTTRFESDLFLSLNPFMVKEDRWKTLKSVITKALAPNKIKQVYPSMVDVCQEMKEYIKENLDTPIEAKYFSSQYTTDSIASCVFSLKSNSFNDPEAEFLKMSKQFFKKGFFPSLSVIIASFMSRLASVLRVRLISKEVTNFFNKVVKDLYEKRKQNNVTRNDFLQIFLDDFASETSEYSLEELSALTMTFFIEGFETSTLMAFTLYLLGLYPQIQQRVREEIKEVSHIDYESMQDLKLLDAVINETLRLYSPGLLLIRKCTQDIILKSGDRTYPITEGMSVIVPVYSISRDPQYYSEPTEFNPNRFYEAALPPSFIPFGLGPEACSGSNFAINQIKVALVYLIQNFKILPRDVDATLPEFNLCNARKIGPSSGLWIKFENLNA